MGVKVKERPEGSGVYWVFINHKGKRKSKKVGSEKTALEVAEKIKARLTLGDVGILETEEKSATFGEYAAIWRDKVMLVECKAGTGVIYESALNKHILPRFNKTLLNIITRGMVKDFLQAKISDGLKPSTVNTLKIIISNVLGKAIDDEVITVNPAKNLGHWHRKGMKAENDTLNKRETALLLETFKKHYPKDYPMALTLARTGMRFGEVCALQWGDIDFNSRFILVQRNVTNRGQIDTPKNNKTHRVDISLQLVEVLTELRKQRKVETLKKGWGEVPEWVFISSKRKPIIMNNWRDKIFNRALEKAGLRKIRVHDLRHGYAHQLIKAGATLLFVSHQLGHSSIKITADCYGHIKRDDEDSKKLIVDCLDDDAFTRNLYATKEINNV